MNLLFEDPNVIVKMLLSIFGVVAILLCTQGCVGRTGGVMVGNNDFWETQYEIAREINRPGKVEMIEELKLKIMQPSKKGGSHGNK